VVRAAVGRQPHNGDGHTAKPSRTWRDRLYAGGKRAFDVQIAVLGLLVLSPLLVLVAVLTKLTSPGALFFGHEREGRGGRVFRCWKFRTMVEQAHAQQRNLYARNLVDGPQFKLPDDPRVTRFGRWLRVTNIDELPQLYNVIRGDMSLVGPRPSPFRENQICVPWRRARLSVRPGITGLWQVCRQERSLGDFQQWIHFDILYVRHMSLGLDLRILLATVFTLGGRWNVPLRWMIPHRQLRALRGAEQLNNLPALRPGPSAESRAGPGTAEAALAAPI
jgi:lipopolysaccharide/colanic/teichoic acid biosynthesis glycosyltransferase